MTIQIVDGSEDVAAKMATWLDERLTDGALLLVGGGSVLQVFNQSVTNNQKITHLNITFSLTDERYGAVGHSESNWNQLPNIILESNKIERIPVLQGKTRDDTVQTWQNDLVAAATSASKVIALFGIGADFHIAGIKPHSTAVDSNQDAVGYKAEDFERITITPRFIKNYVTSCLVYASGPSKTESVESLRSDFDLTDHPSQIIKQIHDSVVYYQP